jgi:hypothetical protein
MKNADGATLPQMRLPVPLSVAASLLPVPVSCDAIQQTMMHWQYCIPKIITSEPITLTVLKTGLVLPSKVTRRPSAGMEALSGCLQFLLAHAVTVHSIDSQWSLTCPPS